MNIYDLILINAESILLSLVKIVLNRKIKSLEKSKRPEKSIKKVKIILNYIERYSESPIKEPVYRKEIYRRLKKI